MRLRTTAILATAALGLTVAGAASAAELPLAPIGMGAKTCVPGPGADCSGVVVKWTLRNHGNLKGINFQGADLTGADVRGANLTKANLRGAKLRHADLRGARLTGARFQPLPARGTRANGATRTCPSGYTDLQYATFTGADIAGANMTCTNAQYASFAAATATTTRLGSSILNWATFTGANLTGATLTRATLVMAYLKGANLTGADLTRAGLVQAYVIGANLSGATLRTADLTGTDLDGANLTDATMLGAVAQQYMPPMVSGVVWANTTCPNGQVTSTGCPLPWP